MEVKFELPTDILKRGYKSKKMQKLVHNKLIEVYSDIRKTTPIHIEFHVSSFCPIPLLAIVRKAMNYIYASRNDKVIVDVDIKEINRHSDKIGICIKRADDYVPFDLTDTIWDLYVTIRPFSYGSKDKMKMYKGVFEEISIVEGPFIVFAEFGFCKYSNSRPKWKVSFPDVDNCARAALSHIDSNKIISIKMRKINTTNDYIHVVLKKPKNEVLKNTGEIINDTDIK